MTDNDIKKALEIHANRGNCSNCAYSVLPSGNCQAQMLRDCLDLINRYETIIDKLVNEMTGE